MQTIDTAEFRRATRNRSRQINRQVDLNPIREHQPLSRADLARRMQVARGAVTPLVEQLIADGSIREGGTVHVPRGRRPTMLHLRGHERIVVAVDVRFDRTPVMSTDFGGDEIALESCDADADPSRLVAAVAASIRRLLGADRMRRCEGVGFVVPGMVDRKSGRVLNSPSHGWRNVDIGQLLADSTGLPARVENVPHACTLARIWLDPAGGVLPASFPR